MIKGGTIVDGLRTPRYTGDVGILGGKIASIGGIDAADAARVIDATGKIVAPGFVDVHTHVESSFRRGGLEG